MKRSTPGPCCATITAGTSRAPSGHATYTRIGLPPTSIVSQRFMSSPFPLAAHPREAQPFEFQIRIHVLDGVRRARDERGVTAGGHDGRRAAELVLHARDEAVDEAREAEDHPGLDVRDRVASDRRLRPH